MSGAVVVVTGALTGIGDATASAFARRGDVVVVSVVMTMSASGWPVISKTLGLRTRCSCMPTSGSSVRPPR
jgi:NAD(P)-dependent dehydrogenase (short-subunit alcohol dehydrogenase family)